MSNSMVIFTCVLGIISALPASGQMNPPITTLGDSADIVAIARLQDINEAGGTASVNVIVQIAVTKYLKGQSPSLNLVASIPAQGRRALGPMVMPRSAIGTVGIWFLKAGPDGYQILPRNRISYQEGDLYLPLTDTSTPAGTTTLDQQLIAYLVRWYQSLSPPTARDDFAFLISFEPGEPHNVTAQQVLSAVAPLIASDSQSQQLTGLIAALRVGSIPAMQTVMANMQTLSRSARFFDVIMGISFYPKDVTWIPVMQQLAEMHTTVQGMDAAGVGGTDKDIPEPRRCFRSWPSSSIVKTPELRSLLLHTSPEFRGSPTRGAMFPIAAPTARSGRPRHRRLCPGQSRP